MGLISVTGDQELYSFGLGDEDAPSITGFATTEAELKYEDEFYAEARDSKGEIIAIVASKPTTKKIIGTFTGFYLAGEDASSLPSAFSFNSRFFIIRNVSKPSGRSKFNEIVLTAQSVASVLAMISS